MMHKKNPAYDDMPETGFAKLYRSVHNQPWKKKPKIVALWVDLLLKASHKATEVKYRNSKITLMPGQLSTTFSDLSKDTGLEKIEVQRGINLLKKLGQIETISDRNLTIISFTKWSKFNQKSDTQSDTQSDMPEPHTKCGAQGNCDTQSDTQSDTQNKNVLRNNINTYADSESQQGRFLELRKNGFEHFWKYWREFKNSINKSTGAKSVTYNEKFSKLFTLKKIQQDEQWFKDEINSMCRFIVKVSKDIQENGERGAYSNHIKMFPALFLKNKEWNEQND